MSLESSEIAVTLAANSSSGSASTLIVAGWPTLIDPMSDSLTETTSSIELRLASTMKPEPLEDEEALDAALDAPDALAAPEPDDPALAADEPLPVPAVTSSPTAPETDAIVPALGA